MTKLSKNKSRPESLREFPKKNQAVTLTRNNFTIRQTMQLSGKIAKQLKYAWCTMGQRNLLKKNCD